MSFEPIITTIRAAGALSLSELRARLGHAFDPAGRAQLVKQGALRVESLEEQVAALPPAPTRRESLGTITAYLEAASAGPAGDAVELSTGPAGWRGF